jgi:hypothetical protein
MGIYDHLWVLGGSRYTEPMNSLWTWAWHGCTNAYFWEWPTHQSWLALLSSKTVCDPHCGHHQHPGMCPTVSKRFLIWCGKEMCPAMISNRFQHDLEAHGMWHPFIDRCLTSDQLQDKNFWETSDVKGPWEVPTIPRSHSWSRNDWPMAKTPPTYRTPESRVMTESFPAAV